LSTIPILGIFNRENLLSSKYSIYLPAMEDLGAVDLEYSPRLPCNDTLYKLWEGQSENSSFWKELNSCLNYDFPQENEKTGQTSTTITTTPTPTETATPTATTNTESTEITSSGGSARTAADNPDSTENPSPGNDARQAFSIPVTTGTGLMIMTVILASFYW
jgi:hypothetical protein